MRSAIATALLALLLSTPVHAEDLTPEARLVASFCGLRGNADQSGYEPLLTASLLDLVKQAQVRNDEIQAATPDEKPPLGDGVPYQSFQDMAPECKLGDKQSGDDETVVRVEYAFPDAQDANWTDRLKVTRDGNVLKIDDVIYSAMGDTYTLRGVLDETLKM